jgi:hypothetical protein
MLDDVVTVLREDGSGRFDRVLGFLGEHWGAPVKAGLIRRGPWTFSAEQ